MDALVLSVVKPVPHLLHCLSFLVRLHGETLEQMRIRCVAGKHGQAVSKPVTAVSDEGNQGFSG